jgi:hypothetical protein
MCPFKKLFGGVALSVTVFSGSIALAQSKFYLKPPAGIGFSNVVSKNKHIGIGFNWHEEIMSFHTTVGAGYRINKLRIETGLGLMKTGELDSSLRSHLGSELYVYTRRYVYYYLAIPLRFAYDIPLKKNLSIQPALGVLFTYNTDGPLGSTLRGPQPHNFWGDAQVTLNYRFNKAYELFGGPSFQHMVSDRTRIDWYRNGDYAYNWMLNAGVNIYFAKKQAADTPKN